MVTFTLLQACQWMHKAHYLNWYTTFVVHRMMVKDSRVSLRRLIKVESRPLGGERHGARAGQERRVAVDGPLMLLS